MRYEGAVYRPPSEAYSWILQVTIGCAQNQCTFCTMYKDKKFRVRKMREIKEDIAMAYDAYGKYVEKIFLADGDALVLKTETLEEIMAEIRKYFPPRVRITSYGAPRDVLNKTDEELRRLRKAGLEMVYMGAESGDDQVLLDIKKGVSAAQIIEAGQRLKKAGIKTSITLISGLGGKERLVEHAKESAKLISAIKPDYLGFLTLMLDDAAPIMTDIREGRLTLLKPADIVEEMDIFLENVDSEGTVFRANHASNYIMLKGTLNKDIAVMQKRIKDVRERNGFRRESSRML